MEWHLLKRVSNKEFYMDKETGFLWEVLRKIETETPELEEFYVVKLCNELLGEINVIGYVSNLNPDNFISLRIENLEKFPDKFYLLINIFSSIHHNI